MLQERYYLRSTGLLYVIYFLNDRTMKFFPPLSYLHWSVFSEAFDSGHDYTEFSELLTKSKKGTLEYETSPIISFSNPQNYEK